MISPTPSPSQPSMAADGSESMDPQSLVSEIIRRHPVGHDFSAAQVLSEHPELRSSRSCVLDLAYEEFCRRRDSGDPIQATAFASQFKDIRQSLLRVIAFDQILHENPSFVETVPEADFPKPGTVFCGFLLLEQIGRGLLSRVFVAREGHLGQRKVVLKVCLRGEQEAGMLGKLQHPSIATVFSAVKDAGTNLSAICLPYQTRATLHHVAEMLHSSSVAPDLSAAAVCDVIQRVNGDDPGLVGPTIAINDHRMLSNSELIAEWGCQLASALQFAHQMQILHCDVKPANVLVHADLKVQLLDFNLASDSRSANQLLGGTIPYMASEQLVPLVAMKDAAPGEVPMDVALSPTADVFGLCATLWHVLTGEPPFGVAADYRERSTAALHLLERQEAGIAEDTRRAAVKLSSEQLIRILERGLKFRQDERFESAAELQAALQPLCARPVTGRRRLVAAVIMATAIVVAAVAFVIVALTPPTLEERLKSADELLESGQFESAEQEARSALKLDATSEQAALTLALALLQQEQFEEAGAVVSSFVLTGTSNQKLRYVDLYCRSVTCEAVSRVAGAPTSEEQIEVQTRQCKAWQDLIEEWRLLGDSGTLGNSARVNEACLLYDYGVFPDAARVLKNVREGQPPFPTLARIQSAVAISQKRIYQAPVPSSLLVAFEGVPFDQLSRFEIVDVLRARLAAANFDPDLSDVQRDEMKREIERLVEEYTNVLIDPHAFQSMYYFTPSLSKDFNRVLVKVLNTKVAPRIPNQMRYLLVTPKDAFAQSNTGAVTLSGNIQDVRLQE